MKSLFTVVLSALMIGTLGVSSCVKKDFDAPPDNSGYDPQLHVTHTIAQLQAMPQGTAITEDIVIAGLVVMDDRSGNYYKKIVIEDSTGGIEFLIDQNNLYNDYPVGRKIYVKCKGLFLGAYGQNQQLGYTPDATGSLSGIPAVLMNDFIVKANYPNPVIADTVTLADLASPSAAKRHLNTLIAIKNVEFINDNVGVPYAQIASLASATNLTIKDCNGSIITLRSSGYAKFQPYLTPTGNGTLVAIYTRYNNTPQLYIRDTTDVQFTGQRCDGSTPGTTILNDGFSTLANWNAVSVSGDEIWKTATYGNPAPCATMSGYTAGNHANEDWLITKTGMDLSSFNTITLKFETAGKYSGNALECYVSTDYSGTGDPNAASWHLLNATYDQSGNFTFTSSGSIDLTQYKSAHTYIAFKYTSTTSAAATWELDNVRVEGVQ